MMFNVDLYIIIWAQFVHRRLENIHVIMVQG